MRIPPAHPLQLDAPARAAEARDTEIFAGAGCYPPPRDSGGSLGGLLGFGRAPKNESGDTRTLSGELEPLRCRGAIFGDLADHAAKAGMAQAFLHGEQDVRIAARLDIDDAIGVEPREMERGREQVTPPQAPEDRTFHPRQDSGEKDRRARIVGKIGTAGDLMQRAARYATARQAGVDGLQPERNRSMASAHAFDLRDARSQIFDDAGFAHNIQKTRAVVSFAICSI